MARDLHSRPAPSRPPAPTRRASRTARPFRWAIRRAQASCVRLQCLRCVRSRLAMGCQRCAPYRPARRCQRIAQSPPAMRFLRQCPCRCAMQCPCRCAMRCPHRSRHLCTTRSPCTTQGPITRDTDFREDLPRRKTTRPPDTGGRAVVPAERESHPTGRRSEGGALAGVCRMAASCSSNRIALKRQDQPADIPSRGRWTPGRLPPCFAGIGRRRPRRWSPGRSHIPTRSRAAALG